MPSAFARVPHLYKKRSYDPDQNVQPHAERAIKQHQVVKQTLDLKIRLFERARFIAETALIFLFSRGMTTIDIALTNVDINQCDKSSGGQFQFEIFAGTHHCKNETTQARYYF